MKKMTLKAIGILIMVLGAAKVFACFRVVVVHIPIVFEHGVPGMGIHPEVVNLTMAAIGLAKVVGGVGLLWVESWAKWVTVAAAGLDVLLLAHFGSQFGFKWRTVPLRTQRASPCGGIWSSLA